MTHTSIKIDILQENIQDLTNRIANEKHAETRKVLHSLINRDQHRINELSIDPSFLKPSMVKGLLVETARMATLKKDIAITEPIITVLKKSRDQFFLTNNESIYTDYLVDTHETRLAKLEDELSVEENDLQLNVLTKVTETYFQDIENGQVIPQEHLLEYLAEIANYLEKNISVKTKEEVNA